MPWGTPTDLRVRLGGTTYVGTPVLVRWRDEEILRLFRSEPDGQLAIDFDVLDEAGKRVATLRKNKILEKTAGYSFVIGATSHRLVEDATQRLVLELVLATPGDVVEVSVDMFLPDGSRLLATPTRMLTRLSTRPAAIVDDNRVALQIKRPRRREPSGDRVRALDTASDPRAVAKAQRRARRRKNG